MIDFECNFQNWKGANGNSQPLVEQCTPDGASEPAEAGQSSCTQGEQEAVRTTQLEVVQTTYACLMILSI